jgi:biotin carboxyl carrier protein
MTPWDSDWAGGTEGSDIRIAKEFALDVRKINSAKEVASEVFPLERAVTPFSEYKLRLGIGIMIEAGIQPKTAEAVRAHVNSGGKLKVGGDVLVGLKRWETLVPKTPEVDKLLENMADQLNDSLNAKATLVTPESLPKDFTAAEIFNALGFQAKGLTFCKERGKKSDLSPLLLAPHVLHREPKTLESGVQFELLSDPADYTERVQVTFGGFAVAPDGNVTLNFQHGGTRTAVTMAPDKEVGDAGNVRKADPGNAEELATEVPGELLSYSVEVGATLKEGDPICKLESMKMEVVISVPKKADGMVVKALPLNARTKTTPGDKLAPGDLLLEMKK